MSILEMFKLRGKVAVVTGGGRGIGFKISEGLAQAGANLVLCSRKLESCQTAAESLTRNGVEVLAVPCDIKNPAQIQNVVSMACERFGQIDILVNNSGASWGAPVEDYPLDGWKKVIETNLTGTFLFTQAVGRVMIRQKRGTIVNIASLMGLLGMDADVVDAIAYSASKGAVIAFTRDLAVKWARHNIRVNAIVPGWIPTEMSSGVVEKGREKLLAHIPMNRFGDGEDLQGAVVYLASEASKYVTGVLLPVDGGYLAI
jgi:NAD(P)-dependent dehydrogenase (short-subunit alcohol dehydrogenase family)